jgi:hypothetical protein
LEPIAGLGYQWNVRARIGIADITAAVVVAVVLFLPARSSDVVAAYPDPASREIELAQAAVAADPADGAAVERLVDRLIVAGQLDWALRVAGAGARFETSPSHWRALLAVSSVHAERIEIPDAYQWANKAVLACDADAADCAPHERVRLEIYVKELAAGVDAIRSGIDPSADPFAFRKAIDTAYPRARLRGKH